MKDVSKPVLGTRGLLEQAEKGLVENFSNRYLKIFFLWKIFQEKLQIKIFREKNESQLLAYFKNLTHISIYISQNTGSTYTALSK